jgi:monovalent cation:H+ antiporter, CPA1 family
MHVETVVVLLFALAAGVSLIARWLSLPYTVALVIAGLLLGTTRLFPAPHLSKELVFAVFLPGLLFEASFHLDFSRFWQNKLALFSLAIPGVAVAIALTAFLLTPMVGALHFVEGFGLVYGTVFAAIIAATDPMAVVALFKSVGAPKRLATLVEGESLLNDGTAVVFFGLVMAIAAGNKLSVAAATLHFIQVVGVGCTVGAVMSYAISRVIQRVDDAMVEITLTTVVAYGSFTLAEQLHASGVIATVVAGMVCGNYAARTGMSATTRLAVESFWEYWAFALNSVVFLLIGLEVHVDDLLASFEPILAGYVAVTVGRAIVVWLVVFALRRTKERIALSWAWVLIWGGLRGGLSMVLALSLPNDFPHRQVLVTMTFGVVVLSILLQGFSCASLLRRLGLTSKLVGKHPLELAKAQLLAAQAGRARLDAILAEAGPEDGIRELREEYRERERLIADELLALRRAHAATAEDSRLSALRQAIAAQKEALLKAEHEGVIAAGAFEEATRELDEQLLRLAERDAAD